MRSGRAAPWADEPDRGVQRFPHEFPRAPAFPRCRGGDVDASERHPPRPLSEDEGGGALPQADSAWARTVWLPRVMRARWMYWGPGARDTLIGQIP